MSEIKVNKISPRTACGTTTLGDSGDTFTIPAGVTITNSGTAAGFGATGAASWDTTVKTSSPFTAVSGVGYFVDTTAGAITVNLPAGTAGDVVAIKDYAGTFDTNNVTLVQNGSDKIAGSAINATLTTEGIAVTLIFIDSTQGWLVTDSGLQSEAPQATFITATGGTIATSPCGNFKTHIFTGPGTFCVSAVGNAAGSNSVDYLVIAGGGSGGYDSAGSGGGAGGFRVSNSYSIPAPTMSPLANPTTVPISATPYSITVGAGGSNPLGPGDATQGSPTTFSTITSTGGGFGVNTGNALGGPGGSGGGGRGAPAFPGAGYPGGTGNTPPVSPPQGNTGGAGFDGVSANTQGGGGGGAGAVGGNSSGGAGAPGGVGSYIADEFVGPTAPSYGTPGPVGSTRYFAGGGGGSTDTPTSSTFAGGAGGGGTGGNPATPGPERDGGVNTGGGGGSGASSGTSNGGSGIVMIRYKFQN